MGFYYSLLQLSRLHQSDPEHCGERRKRRQSLDFSLISVEALFHFIVVGGFYFVKYVFLCVLSQSCWISLHWFSMLLKFPDSETDYSSSSVIVEL